MTLELLRGYFFTLLWLWEIATSGHALIFVGDMAVIFFFVFVALSFLFVAFVLGYSFNGADYCLESIPK